MLLPDMLRKSKQAGRIAMQAGLAMKQLNNRTILPISKDTFITLFLILILVLMFFPLMVTFNDILTRIVVNLVI